MFKTSFLIQKFWYTNSSCRPVVFGLLRLLFVQTDLGFLPSMVDNIYYYQKPFDSITIETLKIASESNSFKMTDSVQFLLDTSFLWCFVHHISKALWLVSKFHSRHRTCSLLLKLVIDVNLVGDSMSWWLGRVVCEGYLLMLVFICVYCVLLGINTIARYTHSSSGVYHLCVNLLYIIW